MLLGEVGEQGSMSFVTLRAPLIRMIFAFTVGIIVLLGSTWAQDSICHDITTHKNFKDEECCYLPSNPCKDEEFCLGVAIAAADTDGCCESFDSCQGTNELTRTLTVLRGLSIGDAVISFFTFLVLCWKGACAYWIQDGKDRHSAHAKSNAVLLALELIDLAMEAAIIGIVNGANADYFVDNIVDANCFTSKQDQGLFERMEPILGQYQMVASFELGFEVVLVGVNLFEVYDNKNVKNDRSERCIGFITAIFDLAECPLAVYNLTLIVEIYNGYTATLDSMTKAAGLTTVQCLHFQLLHSQIDRQGK